MIARAMVSLPGATLDRSVSLFGAGVKKRDAPKNPGCITEMQTFIPSVSSAMLCASRARYDFVAQYKQLRGTIKSAASDTAM
jgi:hypothetical protein